ncbi:protein lifeguard 1-like [Diabrotica undecimpunctata]|uniref:protein lifeguard 1-like n=1 Tax=Diabrotica undecimpunctata TaxID=50387 RepID=UPI003B63BC6D
MWALQINNSLESVEMSRTYDMYGSIEAQLVKGFDFNDASIRRGFIRKVYSILSVQLGITTAVICWFLFHEPTKRFVQHHSAVMYVSLAIAVVTIIVLACCRNVRRKSPANYIFLFIFTIAESFSLASVASYYDVDIVAISAGVTAIVCLGLTLFAFLTTWDASNFSGILVVLSLVLLAFGITAIFYRNNTLRLLLGAVVVLIFSIYLVIDTQMMFRDGGMFSISPEEYIFAVLNLYLDILNIFMCLLFIFGHDSR